MYGPRKAKWVLHTKHQWHPDDLAMRDVMIAHHARISHAIDKHLPCSGFYNYIDNEKSCAKTDDEWLAAYFDDVPRMKQIKFANDPTAVFRGRLPKAPADYAVPPRVPDEEQQQQEDKKAAAAAVAAADGYAAFAEAAAAAVDEVTAEVAASPPPSPPPPKPDEWGGIAPPEPPSPPPPPPASPGPPPPPRLHLDANDPKGRVPEGAKPLPEPAHKYIPGSAYWQSLHQKRSHTESADSADPDGHYHSKGHAGGTANGKLARALGSNSPGGAHTRHT